MTKIFIDTNIFLDFYRSNINTVKIFNVDIFKLKSSLILTDQIHDEFIRNRDKQLQLLIDDCKTNKMNYSSYSLIRSLDEFSDLDKIKTDFIRANDRLIKKLQEMKEDLHKDPIFVSFSKLYNDSEVIKYTRNEDIIRGAQYRKLIGNPPKPKDLKDNSIGDEINWEIILSKLKEDVIIISRDETYEDHITFLKNEFNSRTGKELFINENISFALKKMGEISSSQLIKLEEQQKEKPDEEPPEEEYPEPPEDEEPPEEEYPEPPEDEEPPEEEYPEPPEDEEPPEEEYPEPPEDEEPPEPPKLER